MKCRQQLFTQANLILHARCETPKEDLVFANKVRQRWRESDKRVHRNKAMKAGGAFDKEHDPSTTVTVATVRPLDATPADFSENAGGPVFINDNTGPTCTSWFLEPCAWMGDISAVDGNVVDVMCLLIGKLLCSSCKTRVGDYHWHGSQCSCGQWVVPAFQIIKSRVDVRMLKSNDV